MYNWGWLCWVDVSDVVNGRGFVLGVGEQDAGMSESAISSITVDGSCVGNQLGVENCDCFFGWFSIDFGRDRVGHRGFGGGLHGAGCVLLVSMDVFVRIDRLAMDGFVRIVW
jgi:hypothetical protein